MRKKAKYINKIIQVEGKKKMEAEKIQIIFFSSLTNVD